MSLAAPFHAHCMTSPADVALWVDGRAVSYGELGTYVRSVAGWIAQATDRPNPRVGILSTRSLTAYVGILATSYAGGAFVPFNVKAPRDYLNGLLRSSEVDALIIDQTGSTLIDGGTDEAAPVAVLSPFDTPQQSTLARLSTSATLQTLSPLAAPVATCTDDHAYVMFTSGTTGKPKGIAVTIGNILHLLTTLQQRYRFAPGDRLSQAFELTFDLSVFDIFMALRSGAALHVVPDHQMMTPARFIRQQELTSWFSVPSIIGMLKQMKMVQPNAFPSLRLSLFCGEALPEESARTWQQAASNSRVENLYGPTEATVACLLQDFADPHSVTPGRGIVAIGWPLAGLQAGIVDPQGHFLSPEAKGELAIHGPQVTPGYIDNPDLTSKSFPTLDHPKIGLSRWYLTGDHAYMDREGRYHFLGRSDNQVQLRGHRVELDEIEHHLRRVTGCDTVLAIFMDHPDAWAQEIIGVVPPGPFSPGEIRALLRKHLPPKIVPKKIVILETWPRNASGKIDRETVRTLLLHDDTANNG